MITLRIEPELEEAVTVASSKLGVSRSELFRRSIKEYLKTIDTASPWDQGKHLFGKYSSGNSNLSIDRKQLIKNKVKTKYGH